MIISLDCSIIIIVCYFASIAVCIAIFWFRLFTNNSINSHLKLNLSNKVLICYLANLNSVHKRYESQQCHNYKRFDGLSDAILYASFNVLLCYGCFECNFAQYLHIHWIRAKSERDADMCVGKANTLMPNKIQSKKENRCRSKSNTAFLLRCINIFDKRTPPLRMNRALLLAAFEQFTQFHVYTFVCSCHIYGERIFRSENIQNALFTLPLQLIW